MHHLVPMKSVDQTAFQQVQYLNSAIIRTTYHIVVGWVEGKTIDSCTMN